MRFFFDANITPKIVRALRELLEGRPPSIDNPHTCELRVLKDVFAEDTPDPVWLRSLGQDGDWILISGDYRIRRNPVNLAAWTEANITTFFIHDEWENKHLIEQAATFLFCWRDVEMYARRAERGTAHIIRWKARNNQRIELLPRD